MRYIQFMPDEFLPRLQLLMDEKGIKRKRLCRDLRVSTSTVSDWVNDTRVMSTVNFFRLCEYFNVNPAWLYGITDERKKYKEF